MIVVKLMGGLGNQMFQYAIARALSLHRNTELILDVSYLEKKDFEHSYRSYALEGFQIKATVTNKKLKIKDKGKNILSALINIFNAQRTLTLVRESFFHFDKQILKSSDNSYLVGYWQSFKYFENVKKQIREDFTFSIQPSIRNENIFKKIKSTESVSIHIRRGDYITNLETASYHGICGLDYYQEAIKIMKEKKLAAVFYVFTDDPLWAKNNLEVNENIILVSEHTSSQLDDLFLMSSCNHAIIANSSFSWWGAWLISNSEKIIIAPSKWFTDSSIDISELIPSTWLRI